MPAKASNHVVGKLGIRPCGLAPLPGRSLTLAVLSGTASVRSCEEIGWQAEAPAPPRCKSFECNVGQTLSSFNPAVRPISSQLLREWLPAKASDYAVGKLGIRPCGLAPLPGRSLTLAVLSGTASVRSCEEIGWQAEAPAPPRCKSFECNVGQTLSSFNPAVRPISSQLLREWLPAKASDYAVGKLGIRPCGLAPLPGRSLTLAVLSGTASVRSCEEIGWQAEAPAPPRCKSFECNVGQTLSSFNPAVRPISSQLLREWLPAKASDYAVGKLGIRPCGLARLPGRSLTLAVLSGTASVRSCEEIGWQAEAPAPPRCKSFECNVGQTLSSFNPAVRPISSQLLREWLRAKASDYAVGKLGIRPCGLAPLPGRSLTLAVLSGTASVRSCEEIGWQAEAPAPPRCKSFECNVGQTLSSFNPAVRPISSQLLREWLRAKASDYAVGKLGIRPCGLAPLPGRSLTLAVLSGNTRPVLRCTPVDHDRPTDTGGASRSGHAGPA